MTIKNQSHTEVGLLGKVSMKEILLYRILLMEPIRYVWGINMQSLISSFNNK